MKLDAGLVRQYNETRKIKGTHLCHAPSTNIYFNIMGEGAACWLTFENAPKYPQNSIREIWFGAYFNRLRENIDANDLSETCRVCERNILNGVHKKALAQTYDIPYPLAKYPRMMEFELSNRCNLECTMCNGRLSSAIRKNRDHLPEHQSPYDEEFARQLEEFIPHLKEARFYGGEPFLQEECWAIWDRMIAINPEIEITVATNGTVWSPRVANMLKKGNFRINLSLDGMSRETYESIRKKSQFDKVIANARKFGDYCAEKKSIFCILYNPMRSNWHEIPKLVNFCNENNYYLQFNTIYRPFHLALWTLKSHEIAKIREELASQLISPLESQPQSWGNCENFAVLVNHQLRAWEDEQREREKIAKDYSSTQVAREQARELLRSKLQRKLEASKFKALWTKLEEIEKRAEKNISNSDFYHHFNERPVDWVISDLEGKSSNELVESIFYWAEYY